MGLGITSDASFVMKVCKQANPSKFRTKLDFTKSKVTLNDFLRLFRPDSLSDKIVDCLRIVALKGSLRKACADYE